MSEATPAAGGQGAAPAAAPAAPSATSAALSGTPAAPAAPTSQQAAPAAPAPTGPNVSWLGDGADELTVGYVQNKAWDSPLKAVQSYQNLEKLLGADKAGRAVVVPKEDADPKEWAQVFDKLGRPADPTGYKVDVPEGGNAEFQKSVLGKIHELGLTKQQGEQLVSWYNEQVGGQMKEAGVQKAQQFQTDDTKWKAEQGQALAQSLAAAQSAVRALGLDDATVDAMSDAIGHYKTMNLLKSIGSRAFESEFVGGDGRTAFGGAMTPAQAKAEIQALKGDKAWVAKYLGGDADARAKMEKLQQFAAG